jgi:YHYH protein
VVILASSSIEKTDPFYPRWWTGAGAVQAEMVDGCLAHPQVSGIYHYHILPPCLVNAANLSPTTPCAVNQQCSSDIKGYALASYENYKSEMVLGIAKDGHFILGPYKDDGNLYDCTAGFDQCSGTTSGDGSYVYIFQNKYPYINDCFGPAQPKVYQAGCSTNTCIPQSFAGYLTTISTMMVMMLATVFLL